ncbi:MAG: DUF5977 domain-containing protein, partial [Sediminibacterium sp.]|nr:DUF5977 domain-containing protein [Sediminibacterium sp.]
DNFQRLLGIYDNDKNLKQYFAYNIGNNNQISTPTLSYNIPSNWLIDSINNCSSRGRDKKFIKKLNTCETANKVYRGSENYGFKGQDWTCFYDYVWSDGSYIYGGEEYLYRDPVGCPVITPPKPIECIGPSMKMINGVCEIGIKVYFGSEKILSNGGYNCYYHYVFSDNSQSEESFTDISSTSCINPLIYKNTSFVITIKKADSTCGIGGVPDSINFSVPANIFSSLISVEHANLFASSFFTQIISDSLNKFGKCTYSSQSQTITKIRNNCGVGGTGSSVNYNVSSNNKTSTISLADANSLALNDPTNNNLAQAHANSSGTCTYLSDAQIITKTRNNCGVGGTGSNVTYNVSSENKTSTISLADANSLALNDVTNNNLAQAQANSSGTCTYLSDAQIIIKTRNNCGVGGTGSSVTYNVPSENKSSTMSLSHANSLALNDVDNHKIAQNQANSSGTCTYLSEAQIITKIRNNCSVGGTGSRITYNVSSKNKTSTISLTDANNLVLNDVTNNNLAQDNAITNGTCTYLSQAQIITKTRNNCGVGGTGSSISYNVPSENKTSTISLAHANNLALNDFTNNNLAQNQANATATCTYKSQAQIITKTRNNCGVGGTGSSISYNVPSENKTSTISLAHANNLALNDVTNNNLAQNHANATATCTYTSQAQIISKTRNNCDIGGTGASITYTVPAGNKTSTSSLLH